MRRVGVHPISWRTQATALQSVVARLSRCGDGCQKRWGQGAGADIQHTLRTAAVAISRFKRLFFHDSAQAKFLAWRQGFALVCPRPPSCTCVWDRIPTRLAQNTVSFRPPRHGFELPLAQPFPAPKASSVSTKSDAKGVGGCDGGGSTDRPALIARPPADSWTAPTPHRVGHAHEIDASNTPPLTPTCPPSLPPPRPRQHALREAVARVAAAGMALAEAAVGLTRARAAEAAVRLTWALIADPFSPPSQPSQLRAH